MRSQQAKVRAPVKPVRGHVQPVPVTPLALPPEELLRALPARVDRAHLNMRTHLARAVGRIAALLLVDFGALWVLRFLLEGAQAAGAPGADWLGARVVASGVGMHLGTATVVGMVAVGAYGAGDNRRDPWRIALGAMLGAALPLWAPFWSDPAFVAQQYVLTVLASGAALLAGRALLDAFINQYMPHPGVTRRTVLVGSNVECAEVLAKPALSDPRAFRVVARLDLGGADRLDEPPLESLLQEHGADTMVLCGQQSEQVIQRVVRAAAATECQILSVLGSFEVAGMAPVMTTRRGQPFIQWRAPVLRAQQLAAKRVLDLVVATLVLLLVAPLMALIAVLVKLDSPGPVFFRQRRPGVGGRPFEMLKFRTMRADAEEVLRADPELYRRFLANGCKLSPAEDPRISRLGAFFRRTSLDELPQLWNVLRGDMSLVGPRPVVGPELGMYGELTAVVLSVRPGITGTWQVSGRSGVSLRERVRMDMEYVTNWSVRRDLAILLRTIPAVVRSDGAY